MADFREDPETIKAYVDADRAASNATGSPAKLAHIKHRAAIGGTMNKLTKNAAKNAVEKDRNQRGKR